MFIRMAFLGAAALLGGCVVPNVPVVVRGAELGKGAPVRARDPRLPLVLIERVVDARGTDGAGMLARRPVTLTGMDAYFAAILAGTVSPSFDMVPAGDPDLAPGETPALRLEPRILKAYSQSLATTKTFVVVVEVTLVHPDGARAVRLFRGQDVGVNWWSSDEDVQGGLRGATESCADQIRILVEAQLRRPLADPVAGPGHGRSADSGSE